MDRGVGPDLAPIPMLLATGAVHHHLYGVDALLQARNMLTRALVDHRIAMLQLYRDMGALTFRDGQFTEAVPDAEPTEGL